MALLLLVIAHLMLTTAASCPPEPFALPIKDIQVDPNIPDSLMRGIPAQIGTPAQQIVVLPWAELNNTWIYDQQTYCDPTIIFSDTICRVRRGNPYSDGNSTSFIQALDIGGAGGSLQETNVPGSELGIAKLPGTSLAGTEVFNVGSSSRLSDFPIGIPRLNWDAGYTTLHVLGMGRNSTYMNSLRSTGQIGQRAWSIFWGRMWTTNNPLDGQVVLGGYDASKVIGQNHTQSLDYSPSGCWTGMKVNIADIVVNFRNGKDVSILQKNTVIPTCIVPHRQLLLEAPSAVYTNFETATNTTNIGLSFGLHWSASLFDTGTQFDGDITIVLDSGLEIRVPNDQYIVPFVSVDRSGSRIFNDSQREVLIAGVGDQPATLGRYFLTAAYLMVDQDLDRFTLWQANPSANTRLVSVVATSSAGGTSDDSNCTGGTTVSASPLPNADPSPAKHQSLGVIIGPVVAAVVVLAIIAVMAFLWRRKRRNHRGRNSNNLAPSAAPGPSMHELSWETSKQPMLSRSEQGSDGGAISELGAVPVRGAQETSPPPQHPIYELSDRPSSLAQPKPYR